MRVVAQGTGPSSPSNFFFQAEDGIRDIGVTGVQTCALPIVLIALVSNGWQTALIVLVIVLVVQQLEGNVLQPILQGRGLNLHAAVVILAVTAGGSLYGILGTFLGVPVDRKSTRLNSSHANI